MSELQTQHENWKAARERINANAVKPKIVALVPPTERPAGDVMDIIVAAVANAFGLYPLTVMRDVSRDAVSARRLAMALCVRRPKFDVVTVAKHFEVNVDTILPALMQLDPILNAYVITSKTPLEICLPIIVREWQEGEPERTRPKINDIQNAICKAFGVYRSDLLSNRRTMPVVRVRQAAMALCKHLTLLSLPAIGKAFGGRDHTTVLHAVRRFEPIINSLVEKVHPSSPVSTWANLLRQEMNVVSVAYYERDRK